MKNYITLPILFNTDVTKDLSDCDIEFKLTECEVREVHFFNIDVVLPHWEDNIEYSEVYVSGKQFYSTLANGYILDMVDEQNASEFMYYDN